MDIDNDFINYSNLTKQELYEYGYTMFIFYIVYGFFIYFIHIVFKQF